MVQRGVAEGVHRIEHAFTNFYLVEEGRSVTVVDAGFPRSWALLEAALDELGRTLGDVEALIVTHAHPDHIGFAERLRTEQQVPVWLHERDASLSRHPFRYETERSPAGYASLRLLRIGAAMTLAGAPATKPLGDVRAFAEESHLDVPGRPEVVHTPGHTHGHTSFHLRDRGVLIAGDALVTHEPYTGRTGPRIMAGASNADDTTAIASLARIAGTGAQVVLPGHGSPWPHGAANAVDRAREAGPA